MLTTPLLASALLIQNAHSAPVTAEGPVTEEGPAISAARDLLEQTSSPPLIIAACAPTRPVLELLGPIAAPLLLSGDLSVSQSWLHLLDPQQATQAGLDLEGAALLALWPGDSRFHLSLPFSGRANQAEPLLGDLFPQDLQADEGGWTGHTATKEWRATVDGSRITLHTTGAPQGGRPLDPALLDGLPAAPGCVALLGPAKTVSEKNPILGMSTFLPVGGDGHGTLLVRFKTDKAAPDILATASGSPLAGSSVTVPSGVLSLGINPLDLLEDPTISATLKVPTDDIAALRSRVDIPAGTTVAIFGDPRQTDFTAVIPVTDPHGRAIKPKKLTRWIMKAAHRQDRDITRVDKTSFQIAETKRTFYGAVQSGRVILGTDAQVVSEAAQGLGTPWLSSEVDEWSTRWPVVVSSSQVGAAVGQPDARMRSGLRSVNGLWEVGLQLDLGTQNPNSLGAGLGLAASSLVPNFQTMMHRARRAEAPRIVDELHDAMLAQLGDGPFVVLPAAPRAAEALTQTTIAWTPAPGWEAIDWAPDTPLRGSYWVEVSADGGTFTVHGLIDADGDGHPAHYARDKDGTIVQTTDPQIY